MSLFLYIFIFYIIISLLNQAGSKKKRSYSLIRKEEDNPISVSTEIPEEIGLPDDSINLKQIDNIEKKEMIDIDKPVKEFYPEKGEDQGKEILDKKPSEEVEGGKDFSPNWESGLEIYLSDNILIDGIIISEIIALPRALRPYDFQRYKGLR